MSGKYYPNNYDAIQDAPYEYFEPCSWEEFHDWKLCAWELPSSVTCIMRAQNVETGKITEHKYSNAKAAQKRLIKYMANGDHEVTIVNSEAIHLVKHGNESTND
jgi:hypothetical protein